MQDDQKRVESIEVDIKRVAPLHVKVSAGLFQQVLVGDNPVKNKTDYISHVVKDQLQ